MNSALWSVGTCLNNDGEVAGGLPLDLQTESISHFLSPTCRQLAEVTDILPSSTPYWRVPVGGTPQEVMNKEDFSAV